MTAGAFASGSRRSDAFVRRGPGPVLLAACVGLAVVAGLVAGGLAVGGHTSVIIFSVLLLVPIVTWGYPESAVVMVVIMATLVEQFPLDIGSNHLSDGTDTIPLFTSLSGGAGLTGVAANPAEIVLALTLILALLRGAVQRAGRQQRTQLERSVVVIVVVAIGVGLLLGIAHGGDRVAALWELRPWIYVAMTFVIASRLAGGGRALHAILWALVIGTGIKGIQGVYMAYVTRSMSPRPEAILGHEESFFFGLFIIITALLWLFQVRGRLRTVATVLLPTVVVADLANHRRTAWLIIGVGLILAAVLGAVRLPTRRRTLQRAAIIAGALTLVYLPVFWNAQGSLGQPARAVHSITSPSARDQGSDLYRQLENANLGLNIRAWRPFGSGFGVPIDYSIPIVDISQTDSLIRFVPHDGVLDVWMRLGVEGMLALFALIGAALITGGRVVRDGTHFESLFAIVVIVAVVAWVLQGYEDLGFFWFRIAIVMGCLLGALNATARRLPAGRAAALDDAAGPSAIAS